MMLYGCFHSKAIIKISQARGLRDPKGVGVPLSPLFIKAGLYHFAYTVSSEND